MGKLPAIIMAGGRGKRMDILCHERAKPVLPFAGKFRVIDFSLSNCVNSGVTDIAVLTDYHRSTMASYLRRWYDGNARPNSFHVLEPKKGSYLGTADAVYQNLDFLEKHAESNVVVLAGDHIYKMDYRKMLAFHEDMKADVTIGVIPVPIEQAHRFGIVTPGADGRVTDFVEKPAVPHSNLSSMGIYLFNARILADRLREDAANPASPHDFGHAVIPMMVKRDRVFAYRFNSYWRDIGTVEAYYRANMELIGQEPAFNLVGNWPIYTEEVDLPSEEYNPGAIINSLVSPGCVIKGRVEYSVLSPGVVIEENAIVRNSVLMSDVIIGQNSIIDGAIIDDGVKIGKMCYIGFGKATFPEDKITVVGRNVCIPSHTAVACMCHIPPHTRTDEFTAKAVTRDFRFGPMPDVLAEERSG